MSRKRAEMLAGKKNAEPRKRSEPNGIMEQLVKKKNRQDHSDVMSTLSDIISSPSRPPLSSSSTTTIVALPPFSSDTKLTSVPSTTRSRRCQGELTIANMFDRSATTPDIATSIASATSKIVN